ncbi:MAG: lytic murein transglycosylase [Minisyncoccia bacterium]
MRNTVTFTLLSSIIFFSSALFAPTSAFAQAPAVCAAPATEDIKQACADFAVESAALAKLQAQLNVQKGKSGVLQKDVNALVSQITKAQSKISSQISTISRLSQEIGKKEEAIDSLENELDRERASMTQLVKRTNELDQKGAAYVLLSAESITGFYQDLDDFLSIKSSLYDSLNHVKRIKSMTEEEREDLKDAQFRAIDAKSAYESEKAKLAVSQKTAQSLLSTSKTEEQKQAALVAQQQKKVAAIQSKLFSFAGGATKAIPFKDAYAFAVEASKVTGVRPAFVLAVLTQESNLGSNVGTCNRAGDPVTKSYTAVMHPTRDIPPFLRITKALGINPNTTPVSCRIGTVGWGGAMGPAQFIPSTWESVAGRIQAAIGMSPNPWRARDAIFASSIYLQVRGGTGGEVNERNAACRYYSGRACDGKTPANSFYGNSVMGLTRKVQADIDYLEQYGVSRR